MPIDWPPKVRHDFPLTVTSRGYVARIGGKPRWICGKRPPDEALRIYHAKALAVTSGRAVVAPRPADTGDVMTVHTLLARYLLDRKADLQRGEMSAEAFDQVRRSARRCDAIVGHLPTSDVTPDVVRQLYDTIANDVSTDAAKRAVGHFATACRHAADADWCPPLRLGKVGKLTSRAAVKTVRWRLFTAADIARILAEIDRRVVPSRPVASAAWRQLRAGVLLALNGGLGSMELAQLTVGVVDLARGVVDFARGKTGAAHVVPLWPETIDALRPLVAGRDADALVFVNRGGRPWNYSELRTVGGRLRKFSDDTFKARFNEVLTACGLKVPGESFYKLKHTFATAADEAGDPHATFKLTGHALPGAKGHYVQVSEARLRAVVDHVRSVLITATPTITQPATPPPQPTPEQTAPSAAPASSPDTASRPTPAPAGASTGGKRGSRRRR